jgi:low affinity Fe/Cu permease
MIPAMPACQAGLQGFAMERIFTAIAQSIAYVVGTAWAFAAAAALIIVWGISGPLFGFSDTWQLVVNTATTIVTFLMVFLIQNSQNRDAAALQAKMDELIRSVTDARNQFIGIEHMTEEEVEQIRKALEDENCDDEQHHSSRKSVDQLLKRV